MANIFDQFDAVETAQPVTPTNEPVSPAQAQPTQSPVATATGGNLFDQFDTPEQVQQVQQVQAVPQADPRLLEANAVRQQKEQAKVDKQIKEDRKADDLVSEAFQMADSAVRAIEKRTQSQRELGTVNTLIEKGIQLINPDFQFDRTAQAPTSEDVQRSLYGSGGTASGEYAAQGQATGTKTYETDLNQRARDIYTQSQQSFNEYSGDTIEEIEDKLKKQDQIDIAATTAGFAVGGGVGSGLGLLGRGAVAASTGAVTNTATEEAKALVRGDELTTDERISNAQTGALFGLGGHAIGETVGAVAKGISNLGSGTGETVDTIRKLKDADYDINLAVRREGSGIREEATNRNDALKQAALDEAERVSAQVPDSPANKPIPRAEKSQEHLEAEAALKGLRTERKQMTHRDTETDYLRDVPDKIKPVTSFEIVDYQVKNPNASRGEAKRALEAQREADLLTKKEAAFSARAFVKDEQSRLDSEIDIQKAKVAEFNEDFKAANKRSRASEESRQSSIQVLQDPELLTNRFNTLDDQIANARAKGNTKLLNRSVAEKDSLTKQLKKLDGGEEFLTAHKDNRAYFDVMKSAGITTQAGKPLARTGVNDALSDPAKYKKFKASVLSLPKKQREAVQYQVMSGMLQKVDSRAKLLNALNRNEDFYKDLPKAAQKQLDGVKRIAEGDGVTRLVELVKEVGAQLPVNTGRFGQFVAMFPHVIIRKPAHSEPVLKLLEAYGKTTDKARQAIILKGLGSAMQTMLKKNPTALGAMGSQLGDEE